MNSFISMEEARSSSFEKDIKSFFQVEGKTQEIMIISAYFDLKTIDWIHKFSKKIKI